MADQQSSTGSLQSEAKHDGGKQVKSILKHEHEHHPHPEVKFDEMNILETYHPANKDYGHMKIDEPPTPYNHDFDENINEDSQGVNADDLAVKLAGAEFRPDPKSDNNDEEEDEDESLTDEAIVKKKEFKNKRKNHYNEFSNVQKARELIAKELADIEDD